MGYEVIFKKQNLSPRIDNFVFVSQYLFIKENGHKYLLLKLSNCRDETVTAVKLEVSQKDAKGTDIGTLKTDCKNLKGAPQSRFVLNQKIKVDDNCADFTIQILSADFDGRTYDATGIGLEMSSKKKDETVNALPVQENGIKHSVSVRTVKIPAAVCLIILIMLALTSVFTYFQLEDFSADAATFYYSGVEYEFENGDNSEDSNILVIGSKKSAKNVVIPEKIKNHKIAGIKANAFTGNGYIEKLTVKGEFEIYRSTFAYCSNLTTVNLEKTTRIGDNAFLNCAKLKEVYAYNLTEIGEFAFYNCASLNTVKIANPDIVLTIGVRAFGACPRLITVDIDQFIDYSNGNADFFAESTYIQYLRLRNFNYTSEGHNNGGVTVLPQLFGLGYESGKNILLKELVIDFCDKIADNFCYGMQLTSVTIENLSSTEIGDNAFNSCLNLKQLNVPAAITKIGEAAFYRTAITEFDGSNLQYIGDDAFYRCTLLSAFNMEGNTVLGFIGSGAFSGCSKLKSFFIPKTITEIKNNTFASCTGLTELIIERGGKLLSVGDYAFSGCSGLTEMPLSDKILTVGSFAFFNCTALKSFDFSENLESVGEHAFANCSSFTALTIPRSVREIGLGAFYKCESLKEITLPFIGGSAAGNNYFSYIFGAPSAQEVVYVPASLEKVTLTAETEIAENAFLKCTQLKEIVFETAVTSIGKSAFQFCKNLNNFVISASVGHIGENAFSDCYKLYEVYNLSALDIKRGATYNGRAGFYALKVYNSLSEEQIPKISMDGFEFGRTDDGEWFLTNYTGTRTALVLPENVYYNNARINYKVADYMLTENNKILTVSIPASVTAIGEFSFSYCASLNSVTVPDSVSLIGFGAFAGCNRMQNMTLPFIGGVLNDSRALNYVFGQSNNNFNYTYTNLKTVTITGTGLTSVPDYAFYDYRNLTTVRLPAAVESIGKYAFYACYSLQSFAMPANLISIWDFAFSDCSQITSVTIPDSVTSVGFGAFAGCTSVNRMTLPFIGGSYTQNRYMVYIFGSSSYHDSGNYPYSLKTVTLKNETDIPEYAFYNCYALTTINLPDTVETIGYSAFASCFELSNIDLPKNLKSIGDRALANCSQLKSLDIPSSVKTIGFYAFSNCSSLGKVTLSGDVSIGEYAFAECYSLFEVYNLAKLNIAQGSMAYGKIAYYAIAVYTSLQDEKLKEAVVDDMVYKYIGNNWALTGYTGYATQLKLGSFKHQGKTITSYSIKSTAFRYNYSITTLTIGKEVTSIDEYAFHNTDLRNIIFEDSTITELKEYTFAANSKLRSVILPQGLTHIGSYAFAYCRKLSTIIIPEKVTEISNFAFYDCFSLFEVYNFSKSLSIKKGFTDHGYIGYYALCVNTSSAVPPLEFVDYDDFCFMLYNEEWYLISVSSYGSSLVLPQMFVYKGTEITSYILMESALANIYLNSIAIPRSVKKIQGREFNISYRFDKVHYGGSLQEWTALIKGMTNSPLIQGTVIISIT